MGYLRFTADDFEIVKNMDLYDLGAVTFWLLNSLNGQEVVVPNGDEEISLIASLIKSMWYKNYVPGDDSDAG